MSYSVQSVLGGFVGSCVGSRGQSRRMWNARIHVHCYLHLLLHLWSADVAVHWQWIVVVVVVVVALVFEVLEVEAVEMWVWGWRLCMHRSGSGSEIDSAHVRMNVQFGHLHAHSARVRRICSLARSVAHSNLPTDHDTLAHAAHMAEAVAHGVLALGSDGDGKSYPYHIGTHCYSSAGFGLCSSRDTGIVRIIGKSELSCEQKAQRVRVEIKNKLKINHKTKKQKQKVNEKKIQNMQSKTKQRRQRREGGNLNENFINLK